MATSSLQDTTTQGTTETDGRLSPGRAWLQVFGDAARILVFFGNHKVYSRLGWRHFILGLWFTWAAGVGRYWDHPNPETWQLFGLGSVGYIFVLSLGLFIVAFLIHAKAFSYFGILTFVSLTSPPAVLYAIPVERFMDLDAAKAINVKFLAVVAIWRLLLWFHYLRVKGKLAALSTIAAGLLPMTGIIILLALLNLEKAVFRVMAGLNRGPGTSNDAAYGVVLQLAFYSFLLFIPLLVLFSLSIGREQKRRMEAKEAGGEESGRPEQV